MYKHKEAAALRETTGEGGLRKKTMSQTTHNQGCRYATVQEEQLINTTNELVKRLTWATVMIALAGIVEKNAPIAFWAVVTSILTWKGLSVYAKVHKKHYIRIKEVREAKALEASGEDVLTVSLNEFDKFPVVENGVVVGYNLERKKDQD